MQPFPQNCCVFYFFHKRLPAALHLVAQRFRKVPLDTSATELRGFARIKSIWVTVLESPCKLRSLLLYYPSSQVVPQTFITLACVAV